MDTLKRMHKARTAAVTCSASRHAAQIGAALVLHDGDWRLTNAPRECGESIAATVAALWEARAEIERLDCLVMPHCLGNRMNWIPRDERLPEHNDPVLVVMDAVRVGNPKHPGYPSGRWVAIAYGFGEPGKKPHMFSIEACETGMVTHWMELPAMPDRAAQRLN